MKTKAGAGFGGAAPSPHWTQAAVRPAVLRGPARAGTWCPEGGDAFWWDWTKLKSGGEAIKATESGGVMATLSLVQLSSLLERDKIWVENGLLCLSLHTLTC